MKTDSFLPPLEDTASVSPPPLLLLDSIRADFYLNPIPNGHLVISFSGKQGPHEQPGFAENALRRAGFDVLSIKVGGENWWNAVGATEIADLELAIAKAYRSNNRWPQSRKGIGAGNFAGALLRYGEYLRLDCALLFSPLTVDHQKSQPPQSRPFTSGFPQQKPNYPLSTSSCRYIVVYDPGCHHDEDFEAVFSSAPHSPWHKALVPYGGESVERFFLETGLMDSLLHSAFLSENALPNAWFPARANRLRHTSPTSLSLKAQICHDRGRKSTSLALYQRALQLARAQDMDDAFLKAKIRELENLGGTPVLMTSTNTSTPTTPSSPKSPVELLAQKISTPGSQLVAEDLPPAQTVRGQKKWPDLIEALQFSLVNFSEARVSQIFSRLPLTLGEIIGVAKEWGETLQSQGQDRHVRRVFELINQHAPRNFWPYYEFARIASGVQQHDRALEILGKGLETAGQHICRQELENLTQMALKSLCLVRRDDLRYADGLTQGPRLAGRPVPNALFVSMVKNEADIIGECLTNAYQVGLRNYIIANNGSTDRTREKIQEFSKSHPDCLVLVLDDPIKGYWQATKTNLLWRFGKEYAAMTGVKIDWILPIDGDEILVQVDPAHDLLDILDRATHQGKKIAVNMWCTATPASVMEQLPEDADLSRTFDVVSGYDQSPNTKVFIRADENIHLEMGNHFAVGAMGKIGDAFVPAEYGFFMLHHPYRSRSQWRSKITNGYQALIASDLARSAGGHWRTSYENYQKQGDTYIDDVLVNYFTRNARNSLKKRNQ